MTAEEYLTHLIQVAKHGVNITVHQLEILSKLMQDDKTGKYTP